MLTVFESYDFINKNRLIGVYFYHGDQDPGIKISHGATYLSMRNHLMKTGDLMGLENPKARITKRKNLEKYIV